MKSSSASSIMDLDDMKKSLDYMKANEIFELIERAINIAASQHPKELLQQRDRIVDMLLNSDTHDEKRIINDGDDLWGDFPTIDEAESMLTEVASLDPLKTMITSF
ncbi:uncharacterized protein LOC120277714 [Dioscorea cayenensis subsp. rotundata]|uniref:Uncharacterized protein LOC120277714 n=1 Tax=Dioscorea cayennensis subsp. rotundata TaxID=55577 RepID=A0AB40CKD4_DIOCR|nr:uncharacterized protein LOC120277714 [Dioscorea cayenensis subsp. rotundata]